MVGYCPGCNRRRIVVRVGRGPGKPIRRVFRRHGLTGSSCQTGIPVPLKARLVEI